MSDSTTLTTGSLARELGAELHGPSDLPLRGLNSLDAASVDHVTFISNAKYASMWPACKAGAALISADLPMPAHDPGQRALIVVEDAEKAMTHLLELFAPVPQRPDLGVHPGAFVHPSATLGVDVRIGVGASVDRDAVIGDRVTLHPGVRVYAEVVIGDESELHANCVVRERCRLGRRVVLHAGVVIGTEGFNYRPDPSSGVLKQVPHLGHVELHDGVEIGANSCVDRGKFEPTVIGQGTKIDNLVQIGHNVRIGRMCVIAGLVGISGSVVIGDGVQMAGGSGAGDHVEIGDLARLGARAVALRDVPAGQSVFGCPADEGRAALRQVVALRKLPDLLRRLSRLQEPRGDDPPPAA